MRRIQIPLALGLFFYAASASAIQCYPPPTALDSAFCQDTGLRSMVEEGAQIIKNIRPRLNPEQQQWLRQDQPAWRERTMTACGLGAWSAMISPEITACLRREVSARKSGTRQSSGWDTRRAPGTPSPRNNRCAAVRYHGATHSIVYTSAPRSAAALSVSTAALFGNHSPSRTGNQPTVRRQSL
jgi:hypothetical protein